MARIGLVTAICLLCLTAGTATWAQTDRSIVNMDGFPKARAGVRRAKPAPYRRAKISPKLPPLPSTSRPGGKGAVKPSPIVESQVGVTVWKLRPARDGEDGFTFQIKDPDGQTRLYLGERADIEETFNEGDKVRFGIESKEPGYLYIFDREIHADGTYGAPLILFPSRELDDNTVGPGVLVDVPDQNGKFQSFKVDPQSRSHAGELITVVISPTKLPPFARDRTDHITDTKWLYDVEKDSQFEIFSSVNKDNKIYSKAEAAAACGSATRELVPVAERNGKPCGTKTRELTPDQPEPQTIFSVRTPKGKPAAITFKLVADAKQP
jgi:hypothetical protein